MRRLLAPILLSLGCARAPAPLPFTAEHQVAIVDSVNGMLTNWRAAIASRDADRLVRFYAADQRFRWIEDGAVRYTTPSQLADAYHVMIPTVRAIELTLDNPAVTPLAPGTALVTTGFAEKVTDNSGVITGFAGELSLLVIHADSGWQFLSGHTSSVPREGKPPRGKSN